MDVELVPTGDFHTGGTTALHPNVVWAYKDRPNYYPSSLQVRIWNHFEKCLNELSERRKGKKLFVVNMGDAIDGDHHNTHQLVTRDPTEQANTHIELMKYLKYKLNYQGGDNLVYLNGTYVHVGNYENEIGRQLGAMEHEPSVYASPHLSMKINGVSVWAYHKGVSAGQGQTRGNACINKLKQVYYQCLQSGDNSPDIIISAHTHDQHHATWTRPDGKTMHYLITAPWQDKTRFAFDNLATNKNKVGLQTVTITHSGDIIVNPPKLLPSPLGHTVEV